MEATLEIIILDSKAHQKFMLAITPPLIIYNREVRNITALHGTKLPH